MIYLGILVVLVIASVIQYIDDRLGEKSVRDTERAHKEMYDKIDEIYADRPNMAREKKAQVDLWISEYYKSIGREYTPSMKRVSTKKEREARLKAMKKGQPYEHNLNGHSKQDVLDAIDHVGEQLYMLEVVEPVTFSESRERMARKYMERFGLTYDKAMAKADHWFSSQGITEESFHPLTER